MDFLSYNNDTILQILIRIHRNLFYIDENM